MNIFGYHSSNIRPVSSVYEPDHNVSILDKKVQTSEGLDIVYIDGLSGLEDSTANNLNYLFLTKTEKLNNVLKLNKSVKKYPYFRTSWVKAKDEDKFLVVDTTTGSTRMSGASADITRNYIFEFEFLNDSDVVLRHHHDGTNKFLTVTEINSSELNFQTRSVPSVDQVDTQVFKYVLDDTENIITLMKVVSGIHANVPCFIIGQTDSSEKVLSAAQITATNTQPYSGATTPNQFRLRKKNFASTTYDLNDTYVSYLSSVNHNSLNVSSDRSIKNLENNFIVHSSQGKLISDQNRMDVNLFPLKNQITLEGSTSKNNPYSNQETEVTHREYHKLHTGTYQKYGNDSIYASYTTGTKKIEFPNDKLTYFHIPQNITPYVKLNVNDSKLVKSGAVPGDSPGLSDKVFKRRSNVSKFNNPLDVGNGTMLCSWLSGNENANITPIWVDRYYNPSYSSKNVALTAGIIEPVPFVDSFDALTRTLGASANRTPIYDKLSDLTFEPGILYAYHHVGRGNAQRLIDSLKSNILFDVISNYRSFENIQIRPEFDIASEDYHLDDDGNISSGITTTPASIEIPLIYDFNGDRYGITDVIKNTGSFSLNFWMWCTDWSKPFGNQIIGNHITKGFGIFNEEIITPFITVPDKNKIHVYNSNGTYITSHLIGKEINLYTKKGNLEGFWIVDNNNDVYEYDINGVISNKITSSLLTGKQLVDIEVTDQYLYILVSPQTGEEATYFKYDYSKAGETGYEGSLETANIWNFKADGHSTVAGTLSTCKIHSVSRGLSGSVGVLITQHDLLSSSTTIHNTVSGTHNFVNGSTVDNFGTPWVLQQGVVNTYSLELSANIQAISAVEIIEGVNVDLDNNVWVLHDFFKVTKLDNYRNHLFTVSLTSMLPLSSVRYNRSIDYIAEFNTNGYEKYPVVLVESASGSSLYRLDNNTGNVMSNTVFVTGGTKANQMFLTPSSGRKTYTGYYNSRTTNLNTKPRLVARATMSELYNTSTTTQTYSSFTLQYELSGLSRGWHNFCVVLDAERGEYSLFVDAYRVQTQSISGGKFSFSDIFDSPLTIGSTPFYTKLVLAEHLGQPQHYLANGIKLKNIKLYDKPLSYYDIKNHFQVIEDTAVVKWDIPAGQRNYVDTIDRMFKHSLPGRKSEYVNINVSNSEITDAAAINAIKDEINLSLTSDQLPVLAKINEFGWDSSFTSTSGIEVSAKSVIIRPKTPSQSTTTTLTGDFITYE